MRAGAIIIGDEILSGKFADQNAAFLIGALRQLGAELGRIDIIPDELADIADTAVRFSERFDAVFTSGGVGPTHDDVTVAGISAGFGVPVVRHPVLEEVLRSYYGDRITDSHLRLAEVPEGTELVYGAGKSPKHPPWPVMCFRNIYILPGVPSLFQAKFESIQDRFRSQPFHVARVYVSADEATFAPLLTEQVSLHPEVQFGSYPRFEAKDFQVLITIEGRDAAVVGRARDSLAAALGDHLVRTEGP